ncbi:fatty acid synthase-like [Brevipalpus obovatus]|uniref:fatty acid synthase-like n=1 Tax=Brevipalpus obovatus TaxID=246614 RepID=UPI003D9F19BD
MKDSVVLTGIAGRFPESDNVDQLWEQLLNGSILYTPPVDKHPKKLPFQPKRMGQLRNYCHFDHEFFGQTESDSGDMGPQARMLFEVVYEALYDAGLDPKDLRGARVGFFLGLSGPDIGYDSYEEEKKNPYITYIFSRMCYYYDWKGPCFSVDTACASTIDALIQAHWHIKYGLCDMALVCGLNTITDPFINMCLADIRLLSSTGYERCLDDDADGFIRSECVSAIVLQRKSDAKRIYGEILGTCVNNDGYTEEGITFPNRHAQTDAMRRALEDSGISPTDIDYIEAHITGTQAGDAVETTAIMDAYRKSDDKPLRLGCVKSNVGHGEATAGCIAFIKACKVLQTGLLTPNACYEVPNSHIPALKDGKIVPILRREKLNSDILGVNTFGFGGSNGHVILRRNMKPVTKLSFDDYPILINHCNRTDFGLRCMNNYLHYSASEISKDTLTLLHEVSKRTPQEGLNHRSFIMLDKNGIIKKENNFCNKKTKICLLIEAPDCPPSQDLLKIKFLEQTLKQFEESTQDQSGIELRRSLFTQDIKINACEHATSDHLLFLWQSFLIDLVKALNIQPDAVITSCETEILGRYAVGLEKKKTLYKTLTKNLVQKSKKSNGNCYPLNVTHPSLSKIMASYRSGFIHFSNSTDKSTIDQDDWTIVCLRSTLEIFCSKISSKNQMNGGLNGINHGANHLMNCLETLGRLYIDGHNPDLSAIYEFVQFPLGRECPTISPMLVWNYQKKKFHRLEYGRFYDDMTGIIYSVDLSDPEYEEVSHHIFEDRVIMPAAGYLYLLWKHMTWVKYGSNRDFHQIGFRVWNVRFDRATIVRGSVDFHVKYNPVTKKFAVRFQDTACVTGYGELYENQTHDYETYMTREESDFDAQEVDSERFYLSCRIQGFRYGPKLQGIVSTSVDMTYARIKPTGGFVGLLDSILQAAGLRGGRRHPRAPISVEEFIYEPKVMNEALETSFGEEEPTLEVFICPELRTVTTYGVFLKGLRHTFLPTRVEHPDLKYFHQEFKPCDYEIEPRSQVTVSVEKYLSVCQKTMEMSVDDKMSPRETSEQHTISSYDDERRYPLIAFIRKYLEHFKSFECQKSSSQSSPSNSSIEPSQLFAHYHKAFNHDHLIEAFTSEMISSFTNIIEADLCKKLVRTIVLGTNCDRIADQLAQSLMKWAVATDITKMAKPQQIKDDPSNDASSKNKSPELVTYCDSSLSLMPTEERKQGLDSFEIEFDCLVEGGLLLMIFRTKLLSIEQKILESIKQKPLDIRKNTTKLAQWLKNTKKFIQIGTCTHEDSGIKMVLLKKRPSEPLDREKMKFCEISALNCNWVEDVQEAMEDSEVKRVWLIATDSYRNGVLGFAKCLRLEPFGDRLRTIFWPGNEGKLVSDSPEMESLIERDMMINVFQDGQWGVFHQVEIDVEEEVHEENVDCYVNTLRRGDLTSLSWIKSINSNNSNNNSDYQEDDSQKVDYENVNVHYSALNFRDILLATGRLTADAYPPNNVKTLIGTEFSGLTESGKRVMGICHGQGISTTIPGENISVLYEVPESISLEQAATIPNVYMTVYYALIMRGKMMPGETVLVHAGSGGVGQAAINLCLAMGCKVFTTVSTKEKREFLQNIFPSLTDDCFADSRSVRFEDDILRQTNGRGVDIVLNSLIEDKLQAGFRCLAVGGRFLELGKFDIVQNNDFDPAIMVDNLSFQVICLSYVISRICEKTPEGEALLNEFTKFLVEGMKNGQVKPIHSHVFDAKHVEDAFRMMAKGRHLGKVLIRIGSSKNSTEKLYPRCVKRTSFLPHKCYIIVGGLGGMGLELAYWMITRGAQNLIITSRSGFKSDSERSFIEYLRNYENRKRNIIVSINDCITIRFVQQLFDSAKKLGPIGGIFNLAMVLSDGMFENQSIESFESVCTPKVHITQNLDTISRQCCPELDYFVCFSSISTLGSIGQTNYGLANSFMERLCEERHRQGLPALAVQWGPVADVGVAARLAEEKDLVILGFAGQNIFSCFRALDKFLQMPYPVCQSCIISNESVKAPQFENLFQRVAHILGIRDVNTLDPNTTLSELGLDSLQSAEIRQYFERQYDLSMLGDKPLGSLRISDVRELAKKFVQKPDTTKEDNNLD